MPNTVLLIIFSYITDLILGDPEWFPHPVRIMGVLINSLDKRLNRAAGLWQGRIRGTILVFTVVGASALLTFALLASAQKINILLGAAVYVYFGYASLAVRDLYLKASAVLRSLERRSLEDARLKLSSIVGRDTHNLSEEKVVRATIESVAESTNDGIVAPLFYLFLGGPVLAISYKAISTLDSMVGYKNGRYKDFGWCSAKLDDIVNFIPARISGILIVFSSFMMRMNFRQSFRIMIKDSRNHPSPNSGISEAAMAGALGIQLGGPSLYCGVRLDKPHIGENKLRADAVLIPKALKISFLASFLMVIIGACVRCLF